MLMSIFLWIVLLLLGIAAAPLALGLIPPNPYYGWPTARIASKPELWTQVNLFAGRVVVGTVIVAAGALAYYNGTWLRNGFVQLLFVVVMLGIAAGIILAYARRHGS